jgi:hypothetical protein
VFFLFRFKELLFFILEAEYGIHKNTPFQELVQLANQIYGERALARLRPRACTWARKAGMVRRSGGERSPATDAFPGGRILVTAAFRYYY